MLYKLNQQVKIKGSSRIGEILSYKFETYMVKNKPYESHKYYLKIDGNHYNWYHIDEIESIDTTFDTKFEIGLLKLLIDVNLSNRNYEVVKQLHNEKVKLEGEKK